MILPVGSMLMCSGTISQAWICGSHFPEVASAVSASTVTASDTTEAVPAVNWSV